MSEVPLGAFLSGGVDSSLVVGLMAEASSRPVRTFSIGFRRTQLRRAGACAHRRPPFRDRSSRVRGQAGCAGHHRRPHLALRRAVRRFIGHSDVVCVELARRHVTVVLSGDGGDELFGGYDRYFPHPRVASVRPMGAARQSRRGARWCGPASARRHGQELSPPRRAETSADAISIAIGYFQHDEKQALLAADLWRQLGRATPRHAWPALRPVRCAALARAR